MQTHIPEARKSQTPLRAIIEVIDGELVIFPIAESDVERAAILDALTFIPKGNGNQPPTDDDVRF